MTTTGALRSKAGPLLPWAILGLIVLVALALRLYRLPELTGFGGDQARDHIVVAEMVRTGRPVLEGPIVGTGTYHRGPAFYYLLAPAVWLADGDPAGAAVMTALADVTTVVLLALVGRAIGGWLVGLVAAALWATNELLVIMARFTWNPQFVPALELLCLLALLAVARGRPRWFLVIGPALAVSWQLHDQTVIFGLAVVIWCVIVRPAVPLRIVGASIGLGLLTVTPFLTFEVTHGFRNLGAMVGQVTGLGAGSGGPGSGRDLGSQAGALVVAVRQVLPGIGVVQVLLLAIAVVGVVACVRRVRAREDVSGPVALLIMVAQVPLFVLWPSPLLHHYLYVEWTVLMLLIGLGTAWLWQQRRPLGALAAALVVVVAAQGAIGSFSTIRDEPTLGRGTLAATKDVVGAIVASQGGAPFAVRLVSAREHSDAFDAPFRYLLERVAGPSPGRVDLPTVVIFDPADHADGPASGGTVRNGTRFVAYPAPDLGAELARDSDVVTGGSVSSAWGGNQDAITAATDQGRPNVRITVAPADGPLPDGRTIAQRIDIDEPGRYLVSYEGRADLAAGTGRVIVEARGQNGEHLAVAPNGAGAILEAGPGWSPGSFFVDAPEGTDRLIVYLRNHGVGDIDLRGISVRRVLSEALPGVSIR